MTEFFLNVCMCMCVQQCVQLRPIRIQSDKAKKEEWVGKSTTTEHTLSMQVRHEKKNFARQFCNVVQQMSKSTYMLPLVSSINLCIVTLKTLTIKSGSVCERGLSHPVLCSLILLFILFQREEIHQNNTNPKATIVRHLDEKQSKATIIFSALSHQCSVNSRYTWHIYSRSFRKDQRSRFFWDLVHKTN